MYENNFSQNKRDALDALDALMYSVDAVESVNVDKLSGVIDTTLCSDPEWVYKQNELFNSAEHWLNYNGIKTRTEYGNLLPTYNLFLEIGEWLTKREVCFYRSPSSYDIETRQNSVWGRPLDE